MIKFPTSRRQTIHASWIFTNVGEELNSGQFWRSNQSVTLLPISL